MRVAVIQYPGSNADFDALHVARDVMDWDAYTVFHKESSLNAGGAEPDALIVPGGFSYGDYLRPGAIARFSPISEALVAFAKRGGPIIGICNGFQILTELHILPGALTRNAHLRFECRDVHLKREGSGVFSNAIADEVIRLPIAHADGRYQCDAETLAKLEGEGRIAFRYCDENGELEGANPNGSVASIAGIYDEKKRVLGLMPHPERASEAALGGRAGRHDGVALFRSLAAALGASSSEN